MWKAKHKPLRFKQNLQPVNMVIKLFTKLVGNIYFKPKHLWGKNTFLCFSAKTSWTVTICSFRYEYNVLLRHKRGFPSFLECLNTYQQQLCVQ